MCIRDRLYIVVEGQVDIRTGEQLLETLNPGDILGEMALIDDQPRMASAIARTDCLLTPVNRPHFLALIQRNPRSVSYTHLDVYKRQGYTRP